MYVYRWFCSHCNSKFGTALKKEMRWMLIVKMCVISTGTGLKAVPVISYFSLLFAIRLRLFMVYDLSFLLLAFIQGDLFES